ncbi:MAG: hypothetical protein ABSG62_04975 [Terracidiphilus sp.]|jgi:hypothetical protein
MFKKPASGAGAGAVASINKGVGACCAGSAEANPKTAATVLAASHVFILIIHQNQILDSIGHNGVPLESFSSKREIHTDFPPLELLLKSAATARHSQTRREATYPIASSL